MSHDFFHTLETTFGEIARSIQTSGVFELVGILLAIAIVGVIFVGMLIGLGKLIKKGREYVGATDRIGTFKIGLRHASYITCNVNKNKSFLIADVLDRMKRIPQIKKDPMKLQGVKDLEELWRDDLLYAYDGRVIDSFKTELPNDDIILLSPIPIEDAIVSWPDEKGEWSLTGSAQSMFRRYPKNIQCSELTQHYDVTDLHKTKHRVYILVPITDVVNEKLMLNPKGKVVRDVMRGRQVYINLINLPNKEALAVLAVHIPQLDALYKELEIKAQKLETAEEQRDEYNQLADDLKTQLEGYKARLKTHTMIGYDKPILPIPAKSVYGIAIGAVVAGFASAMIATSDMFARYQGLEYAFLGVSVAIVLLTIKMFDKKSAAEKFNVERPGEKM